MLGMKIELCRISTISSNFYFRFGYVTESLSSIYVYKFSQMFIQKLKFNLATDEKSWTLQVHRHFVIFFSEVLHLLWMKHQKKSFETCLKVMLKITFLRYPSKTRNLSLENNNSSGESQRNSSIDCGKTWIRKNLKFWHYRFYQK